MKRLYTSLAAVAAVSILAACGGGSSSVVPAGGSQLAQSTQTATTQTISQRAISAANAIGAPVKEWSELEQEMSKSGTATTTDAENRVHVESLTPNVCTNGAILIAPAIKGSPNSTLVQQFYSSTCVGLARTVERQYNNANGSGNETVYRTVKNYSTAGKLVAVRSDVVNMSQGTYDNYGYPVPAAGYVRTSTGFLGLGSVKYIDSSVEQVIEPQGTASANPTVQPDNSGSGGGGGNVFCSDSAGYNATGNVAGNTFGWSGGVFVGGTRQYNADGSVTWTGTHTGTSQGAPIGAMYIAFGTPSTQCPIAQTPLFSLGGGTVRGSYSIPIAVSYDNTQLTGLTVTGATLGNGDTLSMTTSGSAYGGSGSNNAAFITGTVSNQYGKAFATITLDQFGDGTLVATGSQGGTFTILDWHVINP